MSGNIGRLLLDRVSVAAARAKVLLPRARKPAAPIAAESRLAVDGLSPLITPNDSFYRIDTALNVPQVDPDHWRLKVHGRVDHPFELTFAEVLAMPMVEEYVTLSCVSNEVGGPLIGTAKWLGVPLATLLDRAGVQSGADQIVGRSVDYFTVGFPTAAALDGRTALLAVGMNGEPLPVKHGFPARLVIAGLYGYVSATKWVTELEATTFAAYDAYWVPRGWSQQAPIKTESRIDVPRGGTVAAGPVSVAGVAWAPTRGIEAVEVQVDGGSWRAPSSRPRSARKPGASGATGGTRPPVRTSSACARPTAPGNARTRAKPRRRRTAPPATTRSSSASRDPAAPGADPPRAPETREPFRRR